jgi:predicted GTPase
MGYGKEQTEELGITIDRADCDLVVSATPINLNRVLTSNKKILHVGYELAEIGSPNLKDVLKNF